MTERSLAFGPNNGLIGTICLPETPQAGGIGVILFNAGVVHRIGPHRFNVRLARKLAASGISSIRFDLSGQGDSPRPHVPQSFEAQILMDVRQAIQALASDTGIDQFALFGYCSGAYQGFPIALAEDRIAGLLMFDAFLYQTWKSRFNRYVMRVRQHGLINSVGGFARREIAAKWKKIFPEESGAGKGIPGVGEEYFAYLPTKSAFATGVQKLLHRDVKVGLIFAGGAFEYYNYADQFQDAFPNLKIGSHLTQEFFPDMDHLVTGLAAQAELMQAIERWMVDLNESLSKRN